MLFYSVSNLLLLVLLKTWLENGIIKLLLKVSKKGSHSARVGFPPRDGGSISSVTLGIVLSSLKK